MKGLSTAFPDYWESGGTPPDFQDAGAVVLAALDALAPPARLSVSETAERRKVRVAGGYWADWRNDVAPYMREPQDVVTSRRFRELVFIGPARSLKTQSLVLNSIAHAVIAQPRTVHVVLPSQAGAVNFSEEDLGPTIRNSPELAARLRQSRALRWDFAGMGRITLGWPVAQQLRGRTIPVMLMPDYDAAPDNIDGEGDLFGLAAKRGETEGSNAMSVAESSPGKAVLDDEVTLDSPHALPKALGIVGLYLGGSRAWWYWTCPDCGEGYSPRFELLRYDRRLEPAEAGASAAMVCPHCGSVHEARHKAELQAGGEWRHESAAGGLTDIGGALRGSPRASYWLDGTAACFATWGDLVRRYEQARRHFEATGDEASLQTVTNVDLGRPYLPKARGASEGLTPAAIKERAVATPLGVCPEGTAFVSVQVDVQANRFACQVEATLPDLEVQLVDRFDITAVPEGAPGRGRRALDPARYLEDWQALDELLVRAWPVAGQGYRLRAVGIICDAGGAPGVTGHAYATFRRLRRDHGKRFRLVRGRGGLQQKRAFEASPETAHQGRRKVARDIRLVWAGTDRLKDELLTGLLREEPGPGAYRVPADCPDDVVAEFCAERRHDDGWKARPGVRRNESWDLAVYGRALRIVLGAERIDWTRPPAWAVAGPLNAWAAPETGETKPGASVATPPAAPPPAQAVALQRKPVKPARRRRQVTGW